MVESACDIGDTGDTGLIPGSGRSPGGANGSLLQFLAWEILWTEEPGGLRPRGSKESDTTERAHTQTYKVRVCLCVYLFVSLSLSARLL